MTKGQAFFGDFIVSIALFVSVLVILFVSFNAFENQVFSESRRVELSTFTSQTAQVLFNFQGSPSNWNGSSVELIGLSSNLPGVLSSEKLLSFLDLDYEVVKSKLFLGVYEFNLSFFEGDEVFYSGIAQKKVALFTSFESPLYLALNASGLTWDLYAGNFTSFGNSTAEFSYFSSRQGAFDVLVSNLSMYNSVLVEDANGLSGNLSSVLSFLNESGVIVYVGNASGSFLASGLGVEVLSSESEGEPGRIVDFSFALRNFEDEPVFSGSFNFLVVNYSDFNASNFKFFISRSVNESHCLACSWSYLNGNVYFFSAFNNSFGQRSGSEVYNIVGWPVSFGTSVPSWVRDVSVLNFPSVVAFHNARPIRARLIVWSNLK